MCVFNGFFMSLGPDFSHDLFVRKDISWRVRKPNAKQNRFQIVTIIFLLFPSAYFSHYVTYVPTGFGKVLLALILSCHGWIQRGTGGPDPPPPPEKSQNLGFLSNTGPDLLKNHKATKPAFNVRPLSARQRNSI